MPIRSFECTKCRYEFEDWQSWDVVRIPNCPKCELTEHVVRVFDAPSVIYKGKGFYTTDNRKEQASEDTEPTRDNEAPSEGEL